MPARILIVDDDRSATALVSELLKAAGYVVSAAADAGEAVEIIMATRPDLAILDIRIPNGSGVSLSASATLRDQFAIPFVFLSSMSDADTVREAAAAGALAFVVKPPDARQFAITIHMALERAQDLRRSQEAIAHLSSALQQGRAVSVAVGVLMEHLRMSQSDALAALRNAARSQRRRLYQLAEELLESTERVNAIAARHSTAARTTNS